MHSQVFEEVGIALEKLHMTPAQFRALPVEQRAEIIAYNRVAETYAAYESLLQEEEAERQSKRKR